MPLALLPQPNLVRETGGSFLLDANTVVVADGASTAVAETLRHDLRGTGLPLPLRGHGDRSAISLTLDPARTELGAEGYTLDVDADRVEIHAAEPAGLFYGVQTLRQLLPAGLYGEEKTAGPFSLPGVHIEDRPRFAWRGAHLDVARHFMPLAFLYRFVDLMALHKLNTFHLHLTDDQGWRMEIKRYPKLTEVGAWRAQSMAGHYEEHRYDGTPHGGFYTQKELRDLVRYARDRFITIVPEIEMPGHAQAAIAAYPELGNLAEPLPVAVDWGVIENVYNVDDATIEFQKHVLDEVMAVFPSPFIHVGGDEVPKTQWKGSEKAQARIKALGLKDEHELQSWFIHQIDAYLAVKGRRLIGWDEILEGGLAPGAAVMSWRGEEGGIAAAEAGHDVVMAPGAWTYFEHYQGPKEKEPLAIGGFLPLEKVYGYDPVPKALPETARPHVLGAQGQIWTEYIAEPSKVEYMAYPRLCALAEVLWSSPEGRHYDEFLPRLRGHLERLSALRVNFRTPDELRTGR